jgi:hypothetical protein
MALNKWQYVPAAILILLLVGEILWYTPITSPNPGSFKILSVTEQLGEAENEVNITFQLDANLPMDATIVVTPVREAPQDLAVYVLYDTDFPAVGTDWISSAMLQAHLNAQLRLRGYSQANLVNVTELESILLRKEPAIVIVASGAFPSDVFSKETNLVKPWIEAGGILVWFGFHIGYYVVERGMKREDITDNMTQNLRENGSTQLGLDGFFEYLEMKDNPKVATYSSPVSEALDTTYDLIQQAPLLHMVWARNGSVFGKVGGEDPFRLRPSISMIPVGMGKILIFGSFLMQSLALNGPELAAWDLAQILCSGVLQMNPGSNQYHRSYHLAGEEAETDVCTLTVESDCDGFIVFEYTSRQSDGVLFYREFIK